MKGIFKKWWFWAILILVLWCALVDEKDAKETPNAVVFNESNGSKEFKKEPVENPEVEESFYQIGDSFKTGKLLVAIEKIEEKQEIKSDNQFIDSITTEGKFIIITAKLTNNDTESRTFSSMQFKIIDDQEREFEVYNGVNVIMILDDKYLFYESCNPGMSRTGVFVFEVPDDVKSYSLKVYSGVGFAAKTSETVKLK